MVSENVYVQLSGTIFDSAVFAGSQCASLTILCGVSGTGVYPVQVNSNGVLMTGSV